MDGRVYLVGAGTGDEELITLKALRLIKEADVIVFDRLINENLLCYSNESCELINVGKASNNHTLPQEKINQLLYDKAIAGNIVVRLKGGDPFVFGRGGEEGIFLKEREIYFEVVPGISSLSGVTAYAGIPITHRGVSNEFHVFTGHEKGEANIDFNIISKLKGTLIFYMGLANIKMIARGLIQGGMSEHTPIAVISKGTYGDQRTVISDLTSIGENIEGIVSPALIVVGETISLRDQLNWFEELPLFGKTILVTRHKEKNGSLRSKLEQIGARVHSINTIDFKPMEAGSELYQVFDNISNFNYLVFNSANGVKYFIEGFIKYKKDIRGLGALKLVAIGEVTKNKIEEYYLSVNIVFDGASSEEYINLLKRKLKPEDEVGIVTSDISSKEKYEGLKSYCRKLKVIDAYRTIALKIPIEESYKVANSDIITFHSPSAVKSFFKYLESNKLNINLEGKVFIAVGTTTAQELKKRSLKNIRIAITPKDEGVINAILENLREG
ncbi:MAG TPA: uroporphyrinogen-III C-methyltransferase [Clostridiaceae bacterium]